MPWRQRCDLKESRSEFLQNKAKSWRHIEFSGEPASGPDDKRGGFFYGTKPIRKGGANLAGALPAEQNEVEEFLWNTELRNEANREFR